MIFLIKYSSTFPGFLSDIFKLIFLLIVFVLILIASHYFTKWYAKSGIVKSKTSNIKILETFSMGPGKQISIVKIGEKYIAVSITKDRITYLTDIDPDELEFASTTPDNTAFYDVMDKTMQNFKDKAQNTYKKVLKKDDDKKHDQ